MAAFGVYFSMYAFRKPFSAGSYAALGPWGMDEKTLLLIAQVVGYALSKLIGVKVVAEFGRHGRASAIVGLVALSWFALVLFALLPMPWTIACLFLNGLPLGMIWGLVFSYLEGRRRSDAMAAILCASFILGSAGTRSAGAAVMHLGVNEYWMPALTGLAFFPLLLACVGLLERLPPPDAADEAARTPRVPMDRAARHAFLRRYGGMLALLTSGYVLLTALRDFRDGFAAELWRAMGFGGEAAIFSVTELPVALVTLAGLGMLLRVRDNLHALLTIHAAIATGAVTLAASTFAFQAQAIGPVAWMILSGAGLYLAYTPFNAMLFDRMVAAIGRPGNAGFLIYVADASGYVGSVVLLLVRSFAAPMLPWVRFYADAAYVTAGVTLVATAGSALFFVYRSRTRWSVAHA